MQTSGFLATEHLAQEGPLDLLSRDGQLVRLPREAVLAVFFVVDFLNLDGADWTRPKSRQGARLPGLRVRLRGPERFSLEGILASNLLDLPQGATLSPLYAVSAWQRAFVPRTAIQQFEVLEVVRPASTRRPRSESQFNLFETNGKERRS